MFWDVRIVSSERFSLLMENGKLERTSATTYNSMLCRAFEKGRWGYKMVEIPPGEDVESLMKKPIHDAEQMAIASASISPKEVPELPPVKPESKTMKPSVDPRDVDETDKVMLLKDVHDLLQQKGIVNTRISYSEQWLRTEYISEDAHAYMEIPRVSLQMMCVAKEGDVMQMAKDSRAEVGGYELIDGWDVEELSEKTGKRAIELLGAKSAPGGYKRVVLDPELAGVFVHEAIGHALEADAVLEGSSCLAGTLNTSIASDCVSIVDDPLTKGYGTYFFDDEGTPAKRTVLIEDGIHTNYMHSRETAA